MRNYNNKYTFNDLIFTILIFLFPILPQYVYIIGGINVFNFTILIFILFFISQGYLRVWKIPTPMYFFWLFSVYYIGRYVADGEILGSITYAMAFIMIPYLIVGYVDTRERFVKLIDVLIAGGAVLGVLGIIESILGFNFIQLLANSSNTEFFHDIRYGLLRIMTTFGQPIAYGIYQVFIFALIYYRLHMDITPRTKRRLIWAELLSIANILLSVSRIPFLMLLMFLILILYRSSKTKFARYMIIAGFLLLVGSIICASVGIKIPFIDDLMQLIQNLFGSNSSSNNAEGLGDRLGLWMWVTGEMDGIWLFGKGQTSLFSYEVYEWFTKTSIENYYLHTLYYTGIIGLIFLLLSYVFSLIFSAKISKKRGPIAQEKDVRFSDVIFVLFLSYFIGMLGVQESDMTRTYVVFVALLLSYNRLPMTPAERIIHEDRTNGI